jgi:diaminopimelate decarboxylase
VSDAGARAIAVDPGELTRLAALHGTPFYLYDADVVAARARALRDALGDRVHVYFAVKANPNLELLKSIRDAVDGLDVSSVGEMHQAAAAGHDMARLSFAGPAKSDAELGAAIAAGIGAISVESEREIDACAAIAASTGKRAGVMVRVNPLTLNRSFGMKMGGRAMQFGIDEESLGAALARIAQPGLAFKGLHVYAGSQCFDAAGLVDGVNTTLEIVRRAEAKSGLACTTINLGGGFGIAHGEADREPDLAELASALRPVLDAFPRTDPPRRFVFELGRYLVATAGLYVTKVIGGKASRGTTFVTTDGGLHHHLAAAGTFGTAMRGNYPLRNVTRPGGTMTRCTVTGPSCNPTDLLGVDVELPEPQPGDLLAVLKAGSYGLTASPLLFLGRPTPAEYVRRHGRVTLARAPRTILDFN